MTHPLSAPPVPDSLRELLAADDISVTVDLLHAYGQVRLGPEDALHLGQLLEAEAPFSFPQDPDEPDGTWVMFTPAMDGTLRVSVRLDGAAPDPGVTLDFVQTRLFLAYLNAVAALPAEPGAPRHPALRALLDEQALRVTIPPNIPFR